MGTFSNLAVASNWNPATQSNSGRLEVFATPTVTIGGGPEPLNHIWQNFPNNGWSLWETLGGQVALDPDLPSYLAVAENWDGRLEAFAVDNNGMVNHIWQTTPGGGWSGWAPLGSQRDVNTLALAQSFRLPRRASGAGVGQNHDGRLEVFGQTQGTPIHIWQVTPGGNWSSWETLGDGYAGLLSFTAGQNIDGRLEVFAVDIHGTVFHTWQGGPYGDWSAWITLGGGYHIIRLALGQNADGRLEVFGITNHGTLVHVWQVSPGGGWSDWVSLGGGYQLSTMAVAQNQDGTLQVFGVDAHGTLLRIWQLTPGGGWSDWVPLGSGHQATKIVVGQNADGRLEVFDIDGGGESWHIWQVTPGGDWSNWAALNAFFVIP